MKKLLDMRFTIGVFFGIVGLLVLGYYFTAGSAPNLWGGLLFTVFGTGMVLLSYSRPVSGDNNE